MTEQTPDAPHQPKRDSTGVFCSICGARVTDKHAHPDAPGKWQPIDTAPEKVVVLTKIDDEHGERNIARLKREGRLWWMHDGAMYVYYTPTHWRPL